MAFKPNLSLINKKLAEKKSVVEEESKEPNHKSNIYKILKTNEKLDKEELIQLTELIDKYIKTIV